MERILDLLYNDLAMSSMAIQFGLIGVLAVAAGLVWHRLTLALPELRPVPARRR